RVVVRRRAGRGEDRGLPLRAVPARPHALRLLRAEPHLRPGDRAGAVARHGAGRARLARRPAGRVRAGPGRGAEGTAPVEGAVRDAGLGVRDAGLVRGRRRALGPRGPRRAADVKGNAKGAGTTGAWGDAPAAWVAEL